MGQEDSSRPFKKHSTAFSHSWLERMWSGRSFSPGLEGTSASPNSFGSRSSALLTPVTWLIRRRVVALALDSHCSRPSRPTWVGHHPYREHGAGGRTRTLAGGCIQQLAAHFAPHVGRRRGRQISGLPLERAQDHGPVVDGEQEEQGQGAGLASGRGEDDDPRRAGTRRRSSFCCCFP